MRFSILSGQVIGGSTFQNEDIIQYDGTSWSLYFDGSDVGLSTARIDAFQVLSDGSILLSFADRVFLSIGTVQDSDIVRFVPTSVGVNTAGTFQFWFRGSAQGFSAGNEDIDAVYYDAATQRLFVSTVAGFSVGSITGADRDIVVCSNFVPNGPCDSAAIFFDGDDIGLTASSEDIDAFYVGPDGTIYFSTTGSFALIGGLTGLSNDVVACGAPITGVNTSCGTLTKAFVGNSSGITANNLTGFNTVP